jgi:LAO/AO transport system kinase
VLVSGMPDDALVAGVRAGAVAAVARAVSVVENARPGFETLLGALYAGIGPARRIGITGPPGAGKSTLAVALVSGFRAQGHRVAVVAVDPTSPFTGGALLGDRIRMEPVALDPDVFIRSMATRGSLGGVAASTREVCDVLDAAGFTRILVETVGVGQSEVDVATLVDTLAVVLVPESGDGIQMLKTGLLEAADLLIVNKADRPGADALQRELTVALDLRTGAMAPTHGGARRPPVLLATASTGAGVGPIVAELDAQWDWQQASGELMRRRERRMMQRARDVIDRAVHRWVWQHPAVNALVDAAGDDLRLGVRSPYQMATEIVAALQREVQS